ncbi:hypothetical protein B0T20DRAFT_488820, partial [Sordaria brevicollis]
MTSMPLVPPRRGVYAWSSDCVSMKEFVTNQDLLLCLGDVIGDRYLLQNLRLTCWAFANAFGRSLFRVYYLESAPRLKQLMSKRQESLALYAPRFTVLDLHCNAGPGISGIHSELYKFRGLKELSLRDIRSRNEMVEPLTTTLINNPQLETLRVMAYEDGPHWSNDPCCSPQGFCRYSVLHLVAERFDQERRRAKEGLDGNEGRNIPLLKLREVTVDHHAMNRFILDLPDPEPFAGPPHNSGNYQKPLYLEKLTDLQYLERLHVEMVPTWSGIRRLNHVRLPNLTSAIAPRLRSITISPPCWEESFRWQNWVIANSSLNYARQVSLGRLNNFCVELPEPANLVFDWTDPEGMEDTYERPEELLSGLREYADNKPNIRPLERLEITPPGDWTKLIPSLKDTLSHFGKLKYFKCHMAKYQPPLCLSLETLKCDKHFNKMMDLAEDFAEVQPSLRFVEINYFLYQVVRWGPGGRDFHMVEILDREREWVTPGDSPWQGLRKHAVPSRML